MFTARSMPTSADSVYSVHKIDIICNAFADDFYVTVIYEPISSSVLAFKIHYYQDPGWTSFKSTPVQKKLLDTHKIVSFC